MKTDINNKNNHLSSYIYDKKTYEKLELFILNFQEKLDDANNNLQITKEILYQNSKMAMMGEMIDSVAHQWIQPLSIISLKASTLVECIDDDTVDKDFVTASCNDIIVQIQHLTDTLIEFRNFFSPDIKYSNINLNILFESVSILIKDDLISSQVSLNIISQDDLYINANENDMKHLFINLINNAKDEMVKNNIQIDKRVVTINCKRTASNKIEILISDNGKGIPKDIIRKIFQPRFTTKKKEGGTGIGLYMCRQIVNKYNGNISVYNENGAVFKIVLNK